MCGKRNSEIYFDNAFIIARLITYVFLIISYFLSVFVFKWSCPEDRPCVLCGMKTAIWELIHFRFQSAFQYNPLVIIVGIIIIYIVIDVLLIIKKLLVK